MQRTAVFAAGHYSTVIRYDSMTMSPDRGRNYFRDAPLSSGNRRFWAGRGFCQTFFLATDGLVAAREAAGEHRKTAIAAVAAELGVPKRTVFDAVVAARDAAEDEDGDGADGGISG